MKKKGMGTSPRGMNSTRDNPLPKPRKQGMRSSGVNADADKVARLHEKAYKQCDSLRIQGK